MNAPVVANAGFGLGLRTQHYQDFLTARQRVDWLEIITDNFLVDGGKPLVILETIRRDYPIAMHGVAMSIGAASGLDLEYLARVKQLARRIEPMWISDHLCWTGVEPNVLHDLYPLPYTEECARLVIAHIRQAQDVLERRLVVENVSSYVRFASSTETEWNFLAHIAEEADCELLLDVNNVYVSSVNHGFSAEAYLQGLPVERVRQIHLAGHSRSDGYIIDTHDHPIAPEVWDLYAKACQRFRNVATMVERDDNIPPLATLIDELDQARAIAEKSVASDDPYPASRDNLEAGAAPIALVNEKDLQTTQRQIGRYILDATLSPLPNCVDEAGPLPGEQGMEIYRRAYRERLTGVLADSYAKCQLYLGTELFKRLAYRYINNHPPQQRNLGRYGAEFAELLEQCYPDNPELVDLARLEWALREVFDAADVSAWTVEEIQNQGVDACVTQWPVLHPTLRLQWMRTNALMIWRAIDDDVEVPEVERWDIAKPLAVWRKGLQPHFKSLDPAEADFLKELTIDNANIAEVAERWGGSLRLPDPATLGTWLAGWWSDEMLRREEIGNVVMAYEGAHGEG